MSSVSSFQSGFPVLFPAVGPSSQGVGLVGAGAAGAKGNLIANAVMEMDLTNSHLFYQLFSPLPPSFPASFTPLPPSLGLLVYWLTG